MIIWKGFLWFGYPYVIYLSICISFNIIMKLILIIGFLLPLICSDALFIFSKTVFLLLFFVIIIISYFLVRLNITLLRKYFLWQLTSLLFYSCYHGSYKTLSLVYCHLAHNSCTQSHGLYSSSTVSPNIFLLSLIVPLFADNNELLHSIQHELFYCYTLYYNIS